MLMKKSRDKFTFALVCFVLAGVNRYLIGILSSYFALSFYMKSPGLPAEAEQPPVFQPYCSARAPPI